MSSQQDVIVHDKNIIEIKNFFPVEECQKIISYFESMSEDWKEYCYYGNMTMNPSSPAEHGYIGDVDMDYLYELRKKIHMEVDKYVGVPMKPINGSAHKWIVGSFADPHSDSMDENGNYTSWRENKYVAILYLNNEYTGGELYFTQHDVEIAPEAGTLAIFATDINYIHGVRMINSGNRYTFMFSWDYLENSYGEDFHKNKKIDEAYAIDVASKKRKVVAEKLKRGEFDRNGVI